MNLRVLRARYLWSWGVLLLILVLADLALFGWLILRSLSREELQRVLQETQAQAEELARRIETGVQRSGGDLLTALLLEEETLTSIDEVIRERRFVRTLEVRDKEGRLVLRRRTETELLDPKVAVSGLEAPSRSAATKHIVERRASQPIPIRPEELEQLEVEVPIGELGFLHFALAPETVQTRLEQFRQRLVLQALGIGVLTLVVGAIGTFALVRLFRRTEQLEAQNREAERLAELGKLAAGLAHEIRNPLNALSLNLQVLEEGQGREPRDASLLASARLEVERLNRLVTEFLTYARPRPPRYDRLKLLPWLEQIRTLLAPELARSGSRLDLVLADPELELEADRDQMVQVLLNLVRNSLQAGEEAGRAVRIAVHVTEHAGGVKISVVDDGPGMEEATAKRAFELFFSTRKGGSGLGLALVERFVRAHGGNVQLESTPGQGTTVTIWLPRSSAVGSAVTTPN
jgi:signal transduction histidine kinase